MSDLWKTHKPEIERLYMVEGKSQAQVSQIMESTHGFVASKWQYENQFQKWGFKKNHGGSKTWRYIREKNKRRKIEGKPDGEVFINGVFQSPQSIATGIRRYAFESTIERHSIRAPSPQTPEGVVVCSPAPSCDWALHWPSDLPWLVFSRQISLPNIVDVEIDLSHSKGLRSLSRPPSAFQEDMAHTLSRTVNSAQDLKPLPSLSKISMALKAIMPEEQEGQHEATAQSLLRRTASHLPELSLALYMISNNIKEGEEPNLIRKILRLAKLYEKRNMKALLSLKDLTAQVLAHKIFAFSIENLDKQLVKIMLDAGMDPNTIIFDDSESENGTALQYVSDLDDHSISTDMASILLSYGSPTEPISEVDNKPPLGKAIQCNNKGLFKLLLDHGSSPSSRVLALATESKFSISPTSIPSRIELLEYFRMLLNAGADLASATWEGRTLLSLTDDPEILKWLIENGCNVNAPQIMNILLVKNSDAEKFTTSPLGVAAYKNWLQAMQVLLEAGADANLPFEWSDAASPLALAVLNKNTSIEAIQLLIDSGADVKAADQFRTAHETRGRTLIQRALRRREICLILLRSGAYASEDERRAILSSPMIEAVHRGDVDMASSLIALGGPANPHDEKSSLSAIALAIMNGDLEMLTLLNILGISNHDRTILSIRDVSTAEYLASAGWLLGILSLNGSRILASAILERNEALVSFLLEWATDQEHVLSIQTHSLAHKNFVSPLGTAIYNDDSSLTQTLVRRGAFVNESDMNMIVWKTMASKTDTHFLRLLDIIPNRQSSIPTAFGMAILSNNLPAFYHLLKLNFSPEGPPTVFFDMKEKRIVLPEMQSGDMFHKEKGGWNFLNTNNSSFGDLEPLQLDSVLPIAVQNGNRLILQTLLHLNIWTAENKGRALIESIRSKRMDLFQDLISFGADVNQRIEGYMYRARKIKYYARFTGSCDKCDVLESHSEFRCHILNCSPCRASCWRRKSDKKFLNFNALVVAMDNDDIQISRTLVDHGCEVNADLGDGFSPLYLATLCQNQEFAVLLLQNGAVDINSLHRGEWNDKSALKTAIGSSNKELINAFLKPGILRRTSQSYAGRRGELVLLKAIKSGDLELMTLLLGARIGLCIEPISNQFAIPGDSLACAISSKGLDNFNMVLMACHNTGIHIEPDTYGRALHVAVEQEDNYLVNLLIERGADVNLLPDSHKGRTCLQMAAYQGNVELVNLLLEKGADVNQRPSYEAGGTALQFAAIKGFIGIVRRLLDAGAIVDAPGSFVFGRTAIEGAAEWGRTDILHLLISEGLPPTGPNRRQYIRAVKLAHTGGHIPIAKFLKDWIGWTGYDEVAYGTEIFDDEEYEKKNGGRGFGGGLGGAVNLTST